MEGIIAGEFCSAAMSSHRVQSICVSFLGYQVREKTWSARLAVSRTGLEY